MARGWRTVNDYLIINVTTITAVLLTYVWHMIIIWPSVQVIVIIVLIQIQYRGLQDRFT